MENNGDKLLTLEALKIYNDSLFGHLGLTSPEDTIDTSIEAEEEEQQKREND